MLALELHRSTPRYLAARAVGSKLPGAVAGPLAPLRLSNIEDPVPPAPGWARVRPLLSGICGSDLNTLTGGSSLYFSALVSMPFVLGHEVVGELRDRAGGLAEGQRVVLDPLLACAARAVEPSCDPCSKGQHGLCERVTGGHISPGLQTGYCRDTGGGWSQLLVAHHSQLRAVPDDVSTQEAVLIEPLACAIHAVRRAAVSGDATVLVVGAGAVGILTLMALREFAEVGRIVVVAKHEGQALMARRYGASQVVGTEEALGAVRRATRAFRLEPERSRSFLLGGVDVAFECSGSASALELALRATRARGRVVLAGMPADADLAPVWFRELEVLGAYSGAGSFDDAFDLAGGGELKDLVGATYSLGNWRAAIDHALQAGRLGTVKVAFDPTKSEREA